MKWIQATDNNLPEEGKLTHLKTEGKDNFGYRSHRVKRFICVDDNSYPYRLVQFLDESTPTVPGSVEDNYVHIIEGAFELLTPKIEETLESVIADFSYNWKGHKERNQGVNEYARHIISLFLLAIPPQPSSLTEDVKDAANHYATEVMKGWFGNFTRLEVKNSTVSIHLLESFLAGHAYKGQQHWNIKKIIEDAVIAGQNNIDANGKYVGLGVEASVAWVMEQHNITEGQPIPLSIVEELEKANPYNGQEGNKYKREVWNKWVSKLRSLLQSQPVPESVGAVKTINVPSCTKHGGTSSFDNCELCKLEKMTESTQTDKEKSK